MGPTSDLGPIDPQFQGSDGRLVAAKTIIAAVKSALEQVAERPETLMLHATLLADTTSIDVQEAHNALRHADAQLRDALACNPNRQDDEVETLAQALTDPLIGEPQSHGAMVSADRAIALHLPVKKLTPQSDQWRMIWQLWIRYFSMGLVSVYEGEQASQIFNATAAT